MHKELDAICAEAGVSYNDAIARVVVEMAASGNLEAIKFVTDRVEGRAIQAVELSGPDGMPLEPITGVTNAVDASRIYMQTLACGDGYLDAQAEDADNVIELAVKRAERDRDE
jgi:hypothetical protein